MTDSTTAVPVHHPAEKESQNDQGQFSKPATNASSPAKLTSAKIKLRGALRQFPDFPIPGIHFIDILPIFYNPATHKALIDALELQVLNNFKAKPDIIVALDARGFLFGPSLALRLGAGFAPVRKRGKLPGPCESASYVKEYGEDYFQIQNDAVKPGQTVLVVDDVIATGGSAQAAGSLVKKLGGDLLGYVFILEIGILKGRDKLTAPFYILFDSSDKPE